MLPEFYFDYYEPFPRGLAPMQNYQMNLSQKQPQQQVKQTPQEVQNENFSSNFEQAPGSPTELGTGYTQTYLKTQIGQRMRITFLLGTNLIQDREGILQEVGISYIVIKEIDTNILTLCDIYAIKFVAIMPQK